MRVDHTDGYSSAFERNTAFQDKLVDADDIVLEVDDRFEDAAGFRFHEDVRATIIFGQLVNEHGQAKVRRALVVNSWRAVSASNGFGNSSLSAIRNKLVTGLPHDQTLLAKHLVGSFAPTKSCGWYDRL